MGSRSLRASITAKASPGLIHRIFEHLEELGLIHPDSVVLDFMSGIGTVNLVAAVRGFKSIAIELESKFVSLIEKNYEKLKKTFPNAEIQIIQGDSRYLSTLLGRADVAVTSPPYAEAQEGGGMVKKGYKCKNKPPDYDMASRCGYSKQEHGNSPGQIANLPDRAYKGIVSPPFIEQNQRDISQEIYGSQVNGGLKRNITQTQPYGQSPGQIGNLKAITSPPYENSEVANAESNIGGRPEIWHRKVKSQGYGQAAGQIGNQEAEDYLSAMQKVYTEAAKVCDVLVTITKNPTRQGKLRRLDEDTKRILEASNWEVLCHHKAVLFQELETATLDGGQAVKKPKGRISFFKILSYKKGSPVAQHEDVIFCRRKDS